MLMQSQKKPFQILSISGLPCFQICYHIFMALSFGEAWFLSGHVQFELLLSSVKMSAVVVSPLIPSKAAFRYPSRCEESQGVLANTPASGSLLHVWHVLHRKKKRANSSQQSFELCRLPPPMLRKLQHPLLHKI